MTNVTNAVSRTTRHVSLTVALYQPIEEKKNTQGKKWEEKMERERERERECTTNHLDHKLRI